MRVVGEPADVAVDIIYSARPGGRWRCLWESGSESHSQIAQCTTLFRLNFIPTELRY